MTKFTEFILEKTEPFEHIIWDWNGTIVNDLDLAVQSLGDLMDEHGLNRLDHEGYRKEFGFPIRDLYERLGFDLEKHCFDRLCERYTEIFNRDRAFQARLHDGMHEILETLGNKKTQSILTAGIQWHINEMVQHFGVHHHFDFIYGIDNLHAASKLERGRQLIKDSGVPSEKTILVGDTDHDFQVAKALGTHVLLIADGYQSFERLLELHPEAVQSRYVFD